MFPGKTSWRSLRTCLTVSLFLVLVRVVPDVIDVLLSPSSAVTELCYASLCCSDWNFVESQSFSFPEKRVHCCTDTQEEMGYEGSPGMAPPLSRRRIDAAYTCVKFVHLLCEGPRKVDGMREKEQSSRGQNSFWKEAAV